MRVLFFDFSVPHLLKDGDYPVGGWAVELNTWLHSLPQTGHEAGLITWKGARAYIGQDTDFEILEAYDPRRGIKWIKYAYSYLPSVVDCVRRYKPDVAVQACASLETGILAAACAICSVPFVYRAQNDTDVARRYRKRMPAYAWKAYELGITQARSILVQNEYQAEQFRLWRPHTPVEKLYNPFRPGPPDVPIKGRDQRGYVAWLGVFQNQKNIPLVVKAAEALPSTEFRIGGMLGGESNEETIRAVERLKVMPNVTMAGYIKRTAVPDFLAGAICLLSTSHYEGFSNTFLEAFDAGTPVVLPRRVDPDGIIEREGLGRVYAEDEHVVRSIEEIASLGEEAFASIGQAAVNYVRTAHSPQRQTQRLVEMLDDAIKRRV